MGVPEDRISMTESVDIPESHSSRVTPPPRPSVTIPPTEGAKARMSFRIVERLGGVLGTPLRLKMSSIVIVGMAFNTRV